jgi:hypothetical protein
LLLLTLILLEIEEVVSLQGLLMAKDLTLTYGSSESFEKIFSSSLSKLGENESPKLHLN